MSKNTKATNEEASGLKANNSGMKLEKAVEELFIKVFNGNVLMFKEYEKLLIKNKINNSKPLLIKNYPYVSIYGSKCYSEFVLIAKNKRVRIECKHQKSAGSVDEKFAYLYLNVVTSYPEKEVILLVDGHGYRAGARQWLADSIGSNFLNKDNKKIKLLYLSEMEEYLNSLKTESELSKKVPK